MMYRSFVRLSVLAASAGLVACQSSASHCRRTARARARLARDSPRHRVSRQPGARRAAHRNAGQRLTRRRISRIATRRCGLKAAVAELSAAFRRPPAGAQRTEPVAARRRTCSPSCPGSRPGAARTVRRHRRALRSSRHVHRGRARSRRARRGAPRRRRQRVGHRRGPRAGAAARRFADQTIDHLRQLLRRRRGPARLGVLRRAQPGSARQRRRHAELRHGRPPARTTS